MIPLSQSWHLSITDAPWTQAGPWSLVGTDSQGNAMCHVTSFLPRLAYADCLGWSLKGGLCIPPKKLTLQKWTMWKWKWKEEDFNFLHIFSNFICFWFPSSLNAQVAPWAKPATWRCRSLVIWWINVSASLVSWDRNASSFGVKKWPLQHLILLTHHLVQATWGQNQQTNCWGKWNDHNKISTLKLVYHGPWQRIDKWQWKQSKTLALFTEVYISQYSWFTSWVCTRSGG